MNHQVSVISEYLLYLRWTGALSKVMLLIQLATFVFCVIKIGLFQMNRIVVAASVVGVLLMMSGVVAVTEIAVFNSSKASWQEEYAFPVYACGALIHIIVSWMMVLLMVVQAGWKARLITDALR